MKNRAQEASGIAEKWLMRVPIITRASANRIPARWLVVRFMIVLPGESPDILAELGHPGDPGRRVSFADERTRRSYGRRYPRGRCRSGRRQPGLCAGRFGVSGRAG